MDPFEWTSDQWTVAGVVVAALGLLLTLLVTQSHRRRDSAPSLLLGPLFFLPPGEHSREMYSYAIGFRVTNSGPGSAIHPTLVLEDPNLEPSVYAEWVHRELLTPGSIWMEFCGLRGTEQHLDVSEEEGRTFYGSCVATIQCWDGRGRCWVFFRGKRKRARRRPFRTPEDLVRFGSSFPSRGEDPLSYGTGPPE